MIKPYLRNTINNHKTQREWKVHSGNTVIDYKTQRVWKIQLTMVITLVSSKNSDEILIMRRKSNNIEIKLLWVMKQMKSLNNSLHLFYKKD